MLTLTYNLIHVSTRKGIHPICETIDLRLYNGGGGSGVESRKTTVTIGVELGQMILGIVDGKLMVLIVSVKINNVYVI